MRPIRLTMSAFGSYSGEEVIDFSGMEQGIFLVTGDTGSGKTTIFDGIVYALYDRTSGGVRDGNMMRSAYAKLSTPTYVELIFSCRDREYRIVRNPDYVRESLRRDKDGNPKLTQEKSKVELYLPDGSSFRGNKKEINGKIEEIIGLDAKQFTQVAMIAQGDFIRLLHARSEERREIFSRIFDTGICGGIQNELRRMEKESYVALKEREQAISEQRGRILCLKESVYDEALEEAKEKEQSEALFLALKEWIVNYRRREKELQKGLQENRKCFQKAAEDRKNGEEILEIRKKIRNYDAWLEENASKEAQYAAGEKEAKDALQQAELLVREYEGKMEEEQQIYSRQEKELLEQLNQMQGMIRLWDSADLAEQEKRKAAKHWGERNDACSEARNRYEKLYEAFFREQAGILARDLKEGIPCPVCGSVTHPSLAVPAMDAPDQQQVEKARRMVKMAEQDQKKAQDAYLEKSRVHQIAVGSLVQEGKRLFGEDFSSEEDKWRRFIMTACEKNGEKLQECRTDRKKRLQETEGQLKKRKTLLAEKKNDLKKRTAEKEEFIRKAERVQGQRKASAEYEKRLCKGYNQKEILSDENLKAFVEEAEKLQEKWKTEGNLMEKSYREIYSALRSNEKTQELLLRYQKDYEDLQKEYMLVHHLSQTAGGSLTGNVKIDFESYVQRRYFQQVIGYANQRLVQMASGQFLLRCRDMDQLSGRGKGGLDLDVYSTVTDSVRDVKTLSGGESFMAALCMALGLADAISRNAGAIRMDTMFIDEGFGSLDDTSREQAVRALYELAGEHRLIGIISHVTELKEQIETKLLVTRKKDGSTAKWVR